MGWPSSGGGFCCASEMERLFTAEKRLMSVFLKLREGSNLGRLCGR